jgi:mRNA interferase YafQ
MRTIERTGQFRRDYKREAKGRYRSEFDAYVVPVIVALANDEMLEPRYRDHALSGDWRDHRDCHIKPDLVRSTASLTLTRCSLFAWDRIRHWGCDDDSMLVKQVSAKSRCPKS